MSENGIEGKKPGIGTEITHTGDQGKFLNAVSLHYLLSILLSLGAALALEREEAEQTEKETGAVIQAQATAEVVAERGDIDQEVEAENIIEETGTGHHMSKSPNLSNFLSSIHHLMSKTVITEKKSLKRMKPGNLLLQIVQ